MLNYLALFLGILGIAGVYFGVASSKNYWPWESDDEMTPIVTPLPTLTPELAPTDQLTEPPIDTALPTTSQSAPMPTAGVPAIQSPTPFVTSVPSISSDAGASIAKPTVTLSATEAEVRAVVGVEARGFMPNAGLLILSIGGVDVLTGVKTTGPQGSLSTRSSYRTSLGPIS